jgi:two-component system, sensor histidine kinase PdtaS
MTSHLLHELQITPDARASNGEPSASEVRFRTMADHAPVLLWMAGTNGKCEFFNRGWLEFTGRSIEEELGSGWAAGIHPEDFQRSMTVYLDAFVARRRFNMEYRLRRHDGEYRWVYDQGAPLFEADQRFMGFIGSCVDVTEQRLARDALRQATVELEERVRERTALAEEREMLLREVHHRVKNDLQLISSMLNMQSRRLSDPESIAGFEDCHGRVQTIALIHEYMYQSPDLASLSLSRNIRSLAASVLRVASTGVGQVELQVEVEDGITLPVDRAIPCGLILNELMSNALKHAFPDGKRGQLRVVLERRSGDRAALSVSDNGIGLPEEPEKNGRSSLGWRLVRAFAEQLNAELTITRDGGTSVGIVFALVE